MKTTIIVEEGYEPLLNILIEALNQAQYGKGKERHADGLPFTEQPICKITRRKGHGFTRGQVEKKILEVDNLSTKEAIIRELLSIIVYTAADILITKEEIEENIK